jgi:hypothetical protein
MSSSPVSFNSFLFLFVKFFFCFASLLAFFAAAFAASTFLSFPISCSARAASAPTSHSPGKDTQQDRCIYLTVVVVCNGMDLLFAELEHLANRQFSLRSAPLSSNTNQIQKTFRREEIRIHGKKHRIRRVSISHPSYPSYQAVGWVLYCDIHSCMICSKKFLRIIGKKDKFHCKICGNIVCRDCLTGMVLIREIPEGYVEACSNCYWGQDEISITQPHEETHPQKPLLDPTPSLPLAPPVSGDSGNLQRSEFWNDLEIEEYDGPSTLNSSQLATFSDLPSPPSISHCSEGSLVNSQAPPSLSVPVRGEGVESNSVSDEDEEDEEDEEKDDTEGEEASTGEGQTAHHAQLMLLLMSLSVATTPNDLTEEEARHFNRQSDRVARENLRESEIEEAHDV